jgi:CheY-like chemotaxis protein/serine phosphatase RsbU (regulator of sigma subunit)
MKKKMYFLQRVFSVLFILNFNYLVFCQENGQSVDQAINETEFKALQYEKDGNALELARCQTKLGFLYKGKNNISKSIEYFQKAIRSNEDLGNFNAIKSLCANIGMLSSENGDDAQAIIYFKKSLRINERAGKKEDIVSDLINIALANQNLKNFPESNQNLERAITLAQELSDNISLKNCYVMLSENYDKSGNQSKAREYFDLAASIKSHIQKEEIKKFESRTKTAEAESYAKDIEIKTKDQKIEKITKEQQLTLDLLQREKELSELKTRQSEAEKKAQAERARTNLIIISLLSFILLLVLGSLFFINRQLNEKKKANNLLKESYQQISDQKIEIEKQRDLVTHQNQRITDSIHYAQRIQQAVLPPINIMERVFPEHFILYRPRDIVSGDFYWMIEKEGIAIIAAVDCTGHGVPGAFMSMLGVSYLNEIVSKITFNRHIRSLHASEILNQLKENVITSLHQTGKFTETKDGMDIALCIIDFEHKHLQYAGAHNPLYLIRNGEFTQIDADRMPIGIYRNAPQSFTNHELSLEKDDLLYIFSDGYHDQPGGPKGTKIFSTNFKKLLHDNHQKPLPEQKRLLEEFYDTWKGPREQVDDVLVMGFKFEPQIVFTVVSNEFLWQDKKILIAEDVDFNFILLVEALKPTKAIVSRVANGLDAIDFCKNNQTDLILMDIRMPVLDGIEATKLIRTFNQDIPIIAQTAHGEDGDKEKIMEAGCNDYITKPINLKTFLSVIKKHLIK